MSKTTELRILVATHKPCLLPNDEIYFPIHCGRAVSKLDEESFAWMKDHTYGDDTGDNISWLNPYFCELTALYWAWKNYPILGSPKKIGLCHYRRYFMDIGKNNEMTVPVHYLRRTISEQFNTYHDPRELQHAISLLRNSELRSSFREYLGQKKGYFFNMFILQKEFFFEYCNILFPVLFELYKTSNWQRLGIYQKRMPGFIAERITGAYLYHLINKRNISFHETLTVIPLVNSMTILKHQVKLIAYLSKVVPEFPHLYSNLLSLQTFIQKHCS